MSVRVRKLPLQGTACVSNNVVGITEGLNCAFLGKQVPYNNPILGTGFRDDGEHLGVQFDPASDDGEHLGVQFDPDSDDGEHLGVQFDPASDDGEHLGVQFDPDSDDGEHLGVQFDPDSDDGEHLGVQFDPDSDDGEHLGMQCDSGDPTATHLGKQIYSGEHFEHDDTMMLGVKYPSFMKRSSNVASVQSPEDLSRRHKDSMDHRNFKLGNHGAMMAGQSKWAVPSLRRVNITEERTFDIIGKLIQYAFLEYVDKPETGIDHIDFVGTDTNRDIISLRSYLDGNINTTGPTESEMTALRNEMPAGSVAKFEHYTVKTYQRPVVINSIYEKNVRSLLQRVVGTGKAKKHDVLDTFLTKKRSAICDLLGITEGKGSSDLVLLDFMTTFAFITPGDTDKQFVQEFFTQKDVDKKRQVVSMYMECSDCIGFYLDVHTPEDHEHNYLWVISASVFPVIVALFKRQGDKSLVRAKEIGKSVKTRLRNQLSRLYKLNMSQNQKIKMWLGTAATEEQKLGCLAFEAWKTAAKPHTTISLGRGYSAQGFPEQEFCQCDRQYEPEQEFCQCDRQYEPEQEFCQCDRQYEPEQEFCQCDRQYEPEQEFCQCDRQYEPEQEFCQCDREYEPEQELCQCDSQYEPGPPSAPIGSVCCAGR
jgi:hypothetical protein